MATLSVAVVGAGPAGATAARLLAGQGAHVSLLEARRLPRRKLCGGGLTPKAQRLVPPAALATVERFIHRLELRGGRFPAIRLDEPGAEIAMVERDRFDFTLAEAAA
ncbi:MAG TPA: NAD(P)-binding protein, partial [Candidatus Limnocylindrales bacterium]